jgi:FAD synthetase
MRTVLVFGSFDVLHDGHRSLFRQARSFGDRLVVVVAKDSTYERLRGFKPVHTERERLATVSKEEGVDRAILGDGKDVYKPVRTVRPDIIGLGYDQESFVDGLKDALIDAHLPQARIVRLSAFNSERFKSSLLKKAGVRVDVDEEGSS